MGKSDANECNESSLSNCRVQLALSTKKDGMILEQISSQEGGLGSRKNCVIRPNRSHLRDPLILGRTLFGSAFPYIFAKSHETWG